MLIRPGLIREMSCRTPAGTMCRRIPAKLGKRNGGRRRATNCTSVCAGSSRAGSTPPIFWSSLRSGLWPTRCVTPSRMPCDNALVATAAKRTGWHQVRPEPSTHPRGGKPMWSSSFLAAEPASVEKALVHGLTVRPTCSTSLCRGPSAVSMWWAISLTGRMEPIRPQSPKTCRWRRAREPERVGLQLNL